MLYKRLIWLKWWHPYNGALLYIKNLFHFLFFHNSKFPKTVAKETKNMTWFSCFVQSANFLPYVVSNLLTKRLHNHIVCIFLALIHCAVPNVASNCLPLGMHYHTDCNCWIFSLLCIIRCLFNALFPGHVLSHWLHLICLRHVFLDMPSRLVARTMQSRTNCTQGSLHTRKTVKKADNVCRGWGSTPVHSFVQIQGDF